MKTLTAIPITELARLAGSKRKVAQLAGLQNLGSINKESVLIDGILYCPSKSTADWHNVWDEIVEKGNISTDKSKRIVIKGMTKEEFYRIVISNCTGAGGGGGGDL